MSGNKYDSSPRFCGATGPPEVSPGHGGIPNRPLGDSQQAIGGKGIKSPHRHHWTRDASTTLQDQQQPRQLQSIEAITTTTQAPPDQRRKHHSAAPATTPTAPEQRGHHNPRRGQWCRSIPTRGGGHRGMHALPSFKPEEWVWNQASIRMHSASHAIQI